jgi:hypothetical protein
MKPTHRRFLLTWGARVLLGLAIGWGVRLLYERRPTVRFASGLMVRSLRDTDERRSRGSHLRDGLPQFFSLDQIMAADDPAAALRTWREAFQQAPKDGQIGALQARVEVSVGALRKVVVELGSSAAFREEISELLAMAGSLGADLQNPQAAYRALVELARLDPGFALDGAQALGHRGAEQRIWEVIAEDRPQHVIDLVRSGKAPADALAMAFASLAARDIEAADALILSLPEELQNAGVGAMADVLARTRPLAAITEDTLGPDGQPDMGIAELIIARVPGPHAADLLLGLERDHPEVLASCEHEVSKLLARQARREPGFVFEWLERHPPAQGRMMNNAEFATVADLARHDPARAAALLPNWAADRNGIWTLRSAKRAVATAWIDSDPMAALSWMAGDNETAALLSASKQTSGSNWLDALRPEQAPALVARLAETAPDLVPSALVKPWIDHDPAAAVAWATGLPPGNERSSSLALAAATLIESGHPDRAPLIEAMIRQAPDALGPLASAVSPSDLPMGSQVAAALPILLAESPDTIQSGVIDHLLHDIRRPSTREATIDAIQQLPDPAQQQRLLAPLAHKVGKNDPLATAQRLSLAMPDRAAARQFMEDTVQHIMSRTSVPYRR